MNWEAIRHELNALAALAPTPVSHDPAPADLMAEWTATVASLIDARRALPVPLTADDPFTILATMTRGANRATTAPAPGPSLAGVRTALDGRELSALVGPDQARDEITRLTHVAYELAHHTRIQAGQHPALEWLQATETALDVAVHAHTAPATAATSGGWLTALAQVQQSTEPIHRRGVTHAHLAILGRAHHLLTTSMGAGQLQRSFGESLCSEIEQLASSYRESLAKPHPALADTSPASQALMRRLATAARDLGGREVSAASATNRLGGLLSTGIAYSGIVAALIESRPAQASAQRIERLSLEFLAHEDWLDPHPASQMAPPSPISVLRTSDASPAAVAPSQTPPLPARIAAGTVLEPDQVVTLCRARDLGKAAAAADPTQPPPELHGTDPATWPQLVHEGRQAISDLVASVTPMAYAITRGRHVGEDQRADLLLAVTRAAHTHQPERGATWPTYAWMVLQNQMTRAVDHVGVQHPRGQRRPDPVELGPVEPPSPAPGPETVVLSDITAAHVRAVVHELPDWLRDPLVRNADGESTAAIAADSGMSDSTVRRRIQQARDVVAAQLFDPSAATSGPAPSWGTSAVLPAEQIGEAARQTREGRPAPPPR